MKPIYEKHETLKRTYNEYVPNIDNSAFVFRIFKDNYIHDFRHIHAEYELIYIKKGNGTKYIGDIGLSFKQGDITLIGSAMPHYYQINPEPNETEVEAWVIQFDKSFLGPNFFEYAENYYLKNYINSSYCGVETNYIVLKQAHDIFNRLASSPKNQRIFLFLELICLLSMPSNYHKVLNVSNKDIVANKLVNRLSIVATYIETHYDNELNIAQMAAMVHLSKSAFCNLFKKNFNCSFTEYLNQYRVSKASKLLSETDKPINEIIGICGFANQSYFNRIFKAYLGKNPNQFRKMLNGNLMKYSVGESTIPYDLPPPPKLEQ